MIKIFLGQISGSVCSLRELSVKRHSVCTVFFLFLLIYCCCASADEILAGAWIRKAFEENIILYQQTIFLFLYFLPLSLSQIHLCLNLYCVIVDQYSKILLFSLEKLDCFKMIYLSCYPREFSLCLCLFTFCQFPPPTGEASCLFFSFLRSVQRRWST